MVPPRPLAESPRAAGARPGPRQPELRSNEILDAAASLFVEKGVASTSIDDIVERAGVAKGTFYHYFSDRTGMLDAQLASMLVASEARRPSSARERGGALVAYGHRRVASTTLELTSNELKSGLELKIVSCGVV